MSFFYYHGSTYLQVDYTWNMSPKCVILGISILARASASNALDAAAARSFDPLTFMLSSRTHEYNQQRF